VIACPADQSRHGPRVLTKMRADPRAGIRASTTLGAAFACYGGPPGGRKRRNQRPRSPGERFGQEARPPRVGINFRRGFGQTFFEGISVRGSAGGIPSIARVEVFCWVQLDLLVVSPIRADRNRWRIRIIGPNRGINITRQREPKSV
jgi:hypothetical protein